MYCILDTETTSLHPGQIAQLSYICLDENFSFTYAKNYFFSVDSMSPGAQAVHWFSKPKLHTLSQWKVFSDSLQDITNDLHKKNIVAHNISFDMKFLFSEYEYTGQEKNRKQELCTMQYFTDICKIPKNTGFGHKRPKVSELLSFLKISDHEVTKESQKVFWSDAVGFHDARFDTTALYCVLKKHGWKKFILK